MDSILIIIYKHLPIIYVKLSVSTFFIGTPYQHFYQLQIDVNTVEMLLEMTIYLQNTLSKANLVYYY